MTLTKAIREARNNVRLVSRGPRGWHVQHYDRARDAWRAGSPTTYAAARAAYARALVEAAYSTVHPGPGAAGFVAECDRPFGPVRDRLIRLVRMRRDA